MNQALTRGGQENIMGRVTPKSLTSSTMEYVDATKAASFVPEKTMPKKASRRSIGATDQLERFDGTKEQDVSARSYPYKKVKEKTLKRNDVLKLIKPSSDAEAKKIKESAEKAFSLGLPYVFARSLVQSGNNDVDGCSFVKELFQRKPNSYFQEIEDPKAWKDGSEDYEFYCMAKKGSALSRLGSIKNLEENGVSNSLALSILSLPSPDIEEWGSVAVEVNRCRVFYSVLFSEGFILDKNKSLAKSIIQGVTNEQVSIIKSDLLVWAAGMSPNHFFRALLNSGADVSIQSGEFDESPIEVAEKWENEENVALLTAYGAKQKNRM